MKTQRHQARFNRPQLECLEDRVMLSAANDIALDSLGNVYAEISFNNAVDADPGPGQTWLAAETGWALAKYTPGRRTGLGPATGLRVPEIRPGRRRQRIRGRRGEGRGLRGRRSHPVAGSSSPRSAPGPTPAPGAWPPTRRESTPPDTSTVGAGTDGSNSAPAPATRPCTRPPRRVRSPTSPSEASTVPCSGPSRWGVRSALGLWPGR